MQLFGTDVEALLRDVAQQASSAPAISKVKNGAAAAPAIDSAEAFPPLGAASATKKSKKNK